MVSKYVRAVGMWYGMVGPARMQDTGGKDVISMFRVGVIRSVWVHHYYCCLFFFDSTIVSRLYCVSFIDSHDFSFVVLDIILFCFDLSLPSGRRSWVAQ